MADLKTGVYKGVKRYWRRRSYRRLATTTTDEFRSKPRKWSWKIRMPRRLKIRFSPKKLIARVHDAYVRMMMRVASSLVVRTGVVGGYGGGGFGEFGMRPVKEYDEKMIIQMYNSMVVRQAQLKAVEQCS
ncbi:hypothetical protein L1987_83006 [Smallanthus sonchifolius]|uniref:Uncharacterized protein n=1 Tax=Smallanthus sonchifolius TaxID=185202 RepID=A0ACB8YC04_9ASTR|nr:hypothetical protein L1987_83006 [Smallanthus sonchifolius]